MQINLKKEHCNSEMVCDSCQNKQKNRAFCYFCSSVQRLPQCAECGRTKCMVADCVVSHAGKSATGNHGTLIDGAPCVIIDACVAKRCHDRHAMSLYDTAHLLIKLCACVQAALMHQLSRQKHCFLASTIPGHVCNLQVLQSSELSALCFRDHSDKHLLHHSAMVGAVCDFCEAWVCHSKKCLQT